MRVRISRPGHERSLRKRAGGAAAIAAPESDFRKDEQIVKIGSAGWLCGYYLSMAVR
jgi:hypothetical protein